MDPQRLDFLSPPPPPPPPPPPDWAALPYDVLALILKRVKLIEEFVLFGSVCKSWRIVAGDKRHLAPQIPWLMLSHNPEDKYHRQIYSLSKEDVLTKNLYVPELYDKRCSGLNYGWVLTVTRLGGEMSLVHPISRRQIELPPHTSIEGYRGKETLPSYIFFSKVALRGNPSESSDFMVMAVHGTSNYVYYWRYGFKNWILVVDRIYAIGDLTCYQDQFYAVTFDGKVLVFRNDHEGSVVSHLIGKIDFKRWRNWLRWHKWLYIVGSTCGLLVVARERYFDEETNEEEGEEVHVQDEEEHEHVHYEEVHVQDEEEHEDVYYEEEHEHELGHVHYEEVHIHNEEELPEELADEEIESNDWRYGSVKFHVFELNLIDGGYMKTTDLGDRAIFMGDNSSMCFDLASKLPGIKSNHIYFTDDYHEMYVGLFKGGGRDMGVYNLKDGRITQFKIDESSHRSRICPPLWFRPSL